MLIHTLLQIWTKLTSVSADVALSALQLQSGLPRLFAQRTGQISVRATVGSELWTRLLLTDWSGKELGLWSRQSSSQALPPNPELHKAAQMRRACDGVTIGWRVLTSLWLLKCLEEVTPSSRKRGSIDILKGN